MTLSIHHRSRQAFSLVELLTIVAIITVMMTLLVPALSGITSTAGRRGAVTIMMNSFEQARVAALESGQTVYIGFADNDSIFAAKEMNYSAFLIFREPTEEEKASGKSYVILKNWTRLPKKIAFKRVEKSLVPSAGGTQFPNLSKELAASFSGWDETLPCIAFNASGAVEEPNNNLRLFLYEGFFSNGKEVPTRDANNLWETIHVSKYTGRAQRDIRDASDT